MTPRAWGAAALLECLATGSGPHALDARPWVLIDGEDLPEWDADEGRSLVARLQRLACPVLILAPPDLEHPLLRACDVQVASLDEAARLIRRIEATPRAAAVFVQLLRHSEGLSLERALFAESLTYSTLQAGPEYQAWLATHRAEAPVQPQETGPAVLIERDMTALRLELNRASTRNAMSMDMRDALIEALELVLADDEISEVRLSGRGKCFSTGGELSEFGLAPDPATAHLVRSLALPGRLLAACAARVTVEVHGACIGSGIEFPAFAGRLLAREQAWFQLPELGFGLIPGAGGCVSIPRRIGRQRTAWMVLSGQRIDVATALDWGLIDGVL